VFFSKLETTGQAVEKYGREEVPQIEACVFSKYIFCVLSSLINFDIYLLLTKILEQENKITFFFI
jgi:hypothetical protein